MVSTTWDELAAAALARQFPQVAGRSPGDVADTVRRIGPIQSQTARSPFLGLAARLPGVTRDAITEAYESFAIVRGSVIRGTVHTTAPDHHVLLEAATRGGNRRLWERSAPLAQHTLEEVWAGIEDFARDTWRTPEELHDHLLGWVAEHGEDAAAKRLTDAASRYLGFGHGGLVRRPRKGDWSGQGAAEYRTAAALLGDRSARLAEPLVLDDLVPVHLAAHGPASRQDLAWWAGLTLTCVDEILGRLDLDATTGPDGREYVDLPDVPTTIELPGVRLLPEFDALMCAYQPSARARFVSPTHHDVLWNSKNGLVLPPLLVDGRITGHWRAAGSARRRPLEVNWFAGTRRPRRAELEEPVAALEAALGITVTSVTLDREAG